MEEVLEKREEVVSLPQGITIGIDNEENVFVIANKDNDSVYRLNTDCTFTYHCELSTLDYTEININDLGASKDVLLYVIDKYYQAEKRNKEAEELYDEFYATKVNIDLTNLLHKDLYQKADNFKNIIEKFYPGNVYYVLEPILKTCNFYIHFPNVTISNDSGDSRDLKDLVLRLKIFFDKDKIKLDNSIYGTRLTLTESESKAGYYHSHLPRETEEINFRKFCLGSTDVATILLDLSVKFDEPLFELFLCMLKNYVSHESTEGGPHIRMSQINTGRSYYLSASVRETIISINIPSRDYSLNYDNGKFFIIPNKSMEETIINFLSSYYYVEKEYMVNIINNEEYFIESSINDNTNTQDLKVSTEVSKLLKVFPIKPSIIKDEDKQTIVPQLSKLIIGYCCDIVNNNINKYYTRKYGSCGF